MSGNTAKDALIAELLGDVGKLHDTVNALTVALPAMTTEAADRFTALISSVTKASDSLRDSAGHFLMAAKADALTCFDRDAKALSLRLSEDMANATKEAITTNARSIIDRSAARLDQATAQVTAASQHIGKRQWLLALLCSVGCSSVLAVVLLYAVHIHACTP